MRLAEQVVGPPYEPPAEQALCDALEGVLWTLLYRDEPDWSDYHFLDGFHAAMVERSEEQLLVRGGIWVDAWQLEPCEAVIRFTPPCRVTLRFANVVPPEPVPEPWALRSRKRPGRGWAVRPSHPPESAWELRFPETEWRFSFEVNASDE